MPTSVAPESRETAKAASRGMAKAAEVVHPVGQGQRQCDAIGDRGAGQPPEGAGGCGLPRGERSVRDMDPWGLSHLKGWAIGRLAHRVGGIADDQNGRDGDQRAQHRDDRPPTTPATGRRGMIE